MQHLRITSPAHLTDDVVAVFTGDPAVSNLAVLRGASIEPVGDIVLADVAREATNELVDRLIALDIPERAPVLAGAFTTVSAVCVTGLTNVDCDVLVTVRAGRDHGTDLGQWDDPALGVR